MGRRIRRHDMDTSFSALQRAENSSMVRPCRFLRAAPCFSALQRAENSSITAWWSSRYLALEVSVLFSEPKIPQSLAASGNIVIKQVSVLFSEPKIPQCGYGDLPSTCM